MPAAAQLLLVVAATLRLPGLGTLLTARPGAALHRFPLHAHLQVELRLPAGPLVLPATVEELQRPADAPGGAEASADFVLLLDADGVGELPAGTEVWLPAEWADIYGIN